MNEASPGVRVATLLFVRASCGWYERGRYAVTFVPG